MRATGRAETGEDEAGGDGYQLESTEILLLSLPGKASDSAARRFLEPLVVRAPGVGVLGSGLAAMVVKECLLTSEAGICCQSSPANAAIEK